MTIQHTDHKVAVDQTRCALGVIGCAVYSKIIFLLHMEQRSGCKT